MAQQTIVITGGFGALARAVAATFASRGYRVALVDRADPPPSRRAAALGGYDLADPLAAEAAWAAVERRWGRPDGLVNLAGAFAFAPLATSDASQWEHLFRANVMTCVNMCRAAATKLPVGGAIVNVGASAASHAAAGMSAYAAAKSAVARLTESLAAELSGRVRVNAVLPLVIDTPQNRLAMPDVDPAAWTSPAAVAEVIVFLTSAESRAINGALIPVGNAA